MRIDTIMESESFRLDSYGNGIGYLLANTRENRSIFVQGDSADEFRCQINALEDAHPDWPTERVLAEMWGEYELVSDPDGPDAEYSGGPGLSP